MSPAMLRRLALLGAILPTLAMASTLVPGGTLTVNTTWNLAGSPYIVQGDLYVYGSTAPRLTIEPGVEVRFQPGAGLFISYNGYENVAWMGELHAVGTALDPILFTANNGNSGGWEGVVIGNNADTGGSTSQFQHAIIEKAIRNLALHNTTQPATLANLELRDASDEGLFLLGVSTDPALSNLSIHDNADFSVLLNGSQLPAMNAVTRTGNGEDRVAYTGIIEDDLTLDIAGYSEPVIFTGTTFVYGAANPRLTLTPGSELRFRTGARLTISYDSGENTTWRGQLTAVGTALDPIVFTADNGLSGGWNGLLIGNNADTGGATCQLEHCLIEKANRNLALHNTTQPATLANLELRDASDEGLFLLGVSTDPVLSNLSIHDNADFSVLLSGSPLPAMSAVTRTGNGENRVAYTGQVEGDLTLDIAGYSEPVVFTGTTYVFGSANPRLTLTAGSELRFAPGASLRISYDTGNNNAWRGQLTAQGSASDPIVFTADDGLSGGWNGITFGNNADFGGAVSSMEHCRIELASENLVFSSTNQPDTLRHCQLGAALTNGLRLTGSYPLVANCTFEDNATAIRLENSATTTIGNSLALSNSFLGNSTWYLYNNGTGDVDARYNGWCTSDGFTPADRIWDEVDDPAKGLVTYLPASEVNVLRISIDYHAAADSFHFEWCPVVGALSYNLYSSPEPGWPINAMGTLIANTTDSWLDLPRSALPDRLFFYATAEIPVATARSGGCR